MQCEICGEISTKQHTFREMMFATDEEFLYNECAVCHSLHLDSAPSNMAAYYPEGYYSFSKDALPWWLPLFHALHFLAPRRMMGIKPCGLELEAVIGAHPKPFARILDVGSGSGKLVHMLRGLGFRAHGVDPFVREDNPYVRYASLDDVEGKWDLIMFHHSLEHMAAHIEVLGRVRTRLAPGGTCLIRIPVANWAWRYYGRDWYQLDPPRHLLIHTPASFELAASAAGFKIDKVFYDSGPGQFFFSEFARRGIPIAGAPHPEEVFSPPTIESYTQQTQLLNLCHMSDQAVFYLKTI